MNWRSRVRAECAAQAGSLGRLLTCSWPDRWLLVQAVAWLGLMRAALAVLRFQQIARRLGLAPGESQPAVDPAQAARAGRIGWPRAAAPRTPWASTCLVQALAGAALLRGHRLPGTLYLGAARQGGAAGAFAAHAWLRCGPAILTGATGRERYAVMTALSLTTATAHETIRQP